MRWTPSDDDLVDQLLASGEPIEEIADRVGRTPIAIYERLRRRGRIRSGPARHDRSWLEAEDAIVEFHWGEEPFSVTAARVGRTVVAVRARLRRRGVVVALRGRETIAAIARRTGYSWRQVADAVAATGIRPVRTSLTPRGRQVRLSDEQVAAVLAYLSRPPRRISDCALRERRSPRTAHEVARRLQITPKPDHTLDDADADRLEEALRTTTRRRKRKSLPSWPT